MCNSLLLATFSARNYGKNELSTIEKLVEEKNKNESRIRFLERMIKTAEIIPDESAEDEIGINTRVTVEFEEDGTTEIYKLVTTMRGDSLNGLVSVESPIGKALLSHKEGDRVYVEVNPSFGYYLIVKKIEKNPEEAEEPSLESSLPAILRGPDGCCRP